MPGKSRERQALEDAATEQGRDLVSQYSPGFCLRATDLCMLGATNAELAQAFNVSESAISLWLVERPAFRRAVTKGREVADGRVARALYERAIGYEHKATKVFNAGGKPLTVDYVERYAPDTAAAALWLSNRRPKQWRSANAGADAQGGFDLNAFVQAIAQGVTAGQRPASDAAKPVEPLDVVTDEPKG